MIARPPHLSEAVIQADIRLALSRLQHNGRRACPVVLRTGVGRYRNLFNDGVVSVGFEGLSDLTLMLDGGLFMALEVKAATGRTSDAQDRFRDHVLSHGGLYVLARSPDDACRAVLEALK